MVVPKWPNIEKQSGHTDCMFASHVTSVNPPECSISEKRNYYILNFYENATPVTRDKTKFVFFFEI